MKSLKKISLLVVLLTGVIIFTNCNNENIEDNDTNSELVNDEINMINIVSSTEYSQLTTTEKNIVDKINSSINGIKGMSLNSKNEFTNYVASFNVNINNQKKEFNDFILISSINSKEKNLMARGAKGGKCTACGIRTGIKCAKAIIKHIKEEGLSELDVNIKVNGNCYDITW